MSFVDLGGTVFHVCEDGPPGAPALLLLHSLGTTMEIWAPQLPALARQYRVVRMDLRGHGLSGATAGDYSMASLAADAMAALDALGIAAAHVAGVSIGGRLCLELAANYPDRVLSIIPCDTGFVSGPPERWVTRMDGVRQGGMAAVQDVVMANWVIDPGLASSRALLRMLLRTDPVGYLGCSAALRDATMPGPIGCPTTVVVGEADPSSPVAKSQEIHAAIPGSRLVVIPGASHIPNFEAAGPLTAIMLQHLAAQHRPGAEAGMAVRRAVLGDAHVDRSEANLTAIDAPFRDFILEGVWGSVWTRPGLSRHQRSLITLSMLAALGLDEEFRLHIRATANTGVSPAEITEALLHVASYAGVPRANHALKIVKELLQ
ncbi:MAG: 4-carboxymuconolactone decarboxylase [Rubritepida sp.]|nr:4-carboxymuconolactone decarboxylase [Rubritepida sp.]